MARFRFVSFRDCTGEATGALWGDRTDSVYGMERVQVRWVLCCRQTGLGLSTAWAAQSWNVVWQELAVESIPLGLSPDDLWVDFI